MQHVRPHYLPLTYQDAADHGRLILRDGSTATLRLARPDDLPAVRAFYARLSPASRRMRFFSETKPGEEVIASLCDSTDPRHGLTLLVWRQADGTPRVIATGSYLAHNADTAEFAVAVDDTFHGRGLGGLLFERLSVLAASHGFTRFAAYTHQANQSMLDVFRHSGFSRSESFEDGVVEVTLSLLPGPDSAAHAARRDRLFTVASLRPFFRPASVAVIGASRDPGNVGHRLFMTLLRGHFGGIVFPVNPKAPQVSGVKAYPSADALPEPVDLAVIAVPRSEVPGVIDACAARGVRAVIVLSRGYAETGPEGRAAETALLDQVRGHGMRLLGPNCLGLINNDPAVRLNASMAAAVPPDGRIALSSQSGALGLALLDLARRRHLGIRMFASMGNKADVTGNDLLYFWEDDPGIDVILLYLESFGNPRRFGVIAREVSRRKPIVCVKAGRPHAPTEDAALDALFAQTGVIRAPSLETLVEVAALLGSQPLPAGPRVHLVTNSFGASTLCADACAAGGLTVAGITGLPAEADTPAEYRTAIAAALADPAVDAVIALHYPLDRTDDDPLPAALRAALDATDPAATKPLLLVRQRAETGGAEILPGTPPLPAYPFPEAAAHALATAWHYRAWRDAPPGVIPEFTDVDLPAIRALLADPAARTPDGTLTGPAAARLLPLAGIPIAGPERDVAVEIEVQPNPVFGPVLSFSLAGYHRSVLHDVAHRMVPLTDRDAQSLLTSIRGHALLAPDRNDLPALEELLLRVSFLAEEFPEITALRLAPVWVDRRGRGCSVGNSLIRCS